MELDERGLVRRPVPRPLPNGPSDVASVLDAALRDVPDHEALVGRHRRFSYRELDAAADQAAAALLAHGVGQGTRIAGSLPNQPELVVAFLGAMRLGAVWVGISTALTAPERAHMLRDSGTALLLTTPEIAATVRECATLTCDVYGNGTWAHACRDALVDPPPRRTIDAHAPAAIAYTSGTTGFPKGAVHSQHNMLWPGVDARENDPGRADERHGVLLPLTLLNLMVLGPIFAWLSGTTSICVDRTDALGLRDWIRDEHISRMTFAPPIVHDLLTHPDVTASDLRSLRRPECGGSSTPNTLRELFLARFGAPVLTGYGLTEAPTAVAREMPGDDLLAGCSGLPFEPVEVIALDEDGRELAAGEVGELCVRARQSGPWAGVYTPFLGYWNQPRATEAALRGGVLHTGDLGTLDDKGRVFVKDRMTDVVIRGGANVYSAEVERVLHDHPAVAACAVVGIADDRLGERVGAVVQLVPGATLDAEALTAHCREHLARYKVPERWLAVDRFERTPMGKIPKAPLRRLFA